MRWSGSNFVFWRYDRQNQGDCVKQFEIHEPIHSIEWIGGHTITASGDLIINGTVREFKRVSSGLGTWGNYSINNLYPYVENIPSHIEVMDEYGFLNILKPYAGEKPRWEKNPFTPNPLNEEEVAELEKSEITDIHLNDFGITFGKVRINFAWKNHAGRNLAIYVFLI